MNCLLLGAALSLAINGEADLKSVRHNPVLKKQIQSLLKSSPPQLQALLKELGIDPLRHVDRVQVALRHYAGSQKEEPVVILHGRFFPKKFRKVWAATKQDTGLKETTFLGKKAYEGKGRLPMFVVESARKVLVGRRHDLEQVMKGRMNSKGPLRNYETSEGSHKHCKRTEIHNTGPRTSRKGRSKSSKGP